jgi:hypothetical protein
VWSCFATSLHCQDTRSYFPRLNRSISYIPSAETIKNAPVVSFFRVYSPQRSTNFRVNQETSFASLPYFLLYFHATT